MARKIKTEWTSITRAQVRALLARKGVDRSDSRVTIELADQQGNMSTNNVQREDGSAFYLRVWCQGYDGYDVELIESSRALAKVEDDEIRCGNIAQKDAHVRATLEYLAANDTNPEGSAATVGEMIAELAQPQPQDGRCRISGRYHRYTDVPRYTTSDGALLTLGGYVECSHCHQVTHYGDLRADYQETLCQHAARTHQGNLSEPFALYALEALGVRHPETNMRVRVAEQLGRQVFRVGLFTVTVQYQGDDPEAGPVFTVAANPRYAGDPE